MSRLGLIGFCFLAASLAAVEQRSSYLAFAAGAPPDGVSAGLFKGETGEFGEAPSAALRSAEDEEGHSPQAVISLAERSRPSEGNPAGAVDAELPGEEAGGSEMSTYERQVQKERQARRRLAKSTLLLVAVMIILYGLYRYSLWYAGRKLFLKILTNPDITLYEMMPKGLDALAFLLLGIPSLLVPVAQFYFIISFFRWLRHLILLMLKKKGASAAGEKLKASETADPAVAPAAPLSGFDPQ